MIKTRVFKSTLVVAMLFVFALPAHASNTASVTLNASQSQYLLASSSSSVEVSGDMTIEAWVKLNVLPASNQVYTLVGKMGNSDANSSYAVWLENNSGQQQILFGVTQGTNHTGPTYNWSPTAGTWYHIAAVHGVNGVMTVYVNGVLIGTGSGFPSNMNVNATALGIGQDLLGDGFFDGKIDDVRLYSVARTQSEIQSDYQQELAGNETGLNAYWTLNNVLTDSTSNGNTLSAFGSPSFTSDVPFPVASVPTITSFSANPTTILVGQSSQLSWTVSGATSMAIDQGVGTVTGTSTTVYPTQTTTYTLTATNASGSSTATATVFVVNNPTAVRKTVDEAVSSNATLQNDDQLTLQLVAGKTYIIDGLIAASSTNGTPDLKIGMSVPASSDLIVSYFDSVGATSAGGLINSSGTASIRLPVPANTPTPVLIHGTVVAGGNGPLQLLWSQFASNSNPTKVLKGSFLKITEIP